MSKATELLLKIDKKEEAKEEKNNLDEQLQLLKQAVSNLQDCVQKVENASEDGADMTTALNATKDSMNTAVDAFCRAVTRAESTVLKVEMTDECKQEIVSTRQSLIDAEKNLLATHRTKVIRILDEHISEFKDYVRYNDGVYLSTRVFWWCAGVAYATSLCTLWWLGNMILNWWRSL